MGKRKHGTKRNGKQGTKSGQNGSARPAGQGASAAPLSSGALEGASAFGEAVRDGAGKVTALARDAQESARGAGQSALDFAKRNPLPLALAGVGVACTGIGLAFWLFGDRDAIKQALSAGSARTGANGQAAGEQDLSQVRYAALARAANGTQRIAKQAQLKIEDAASVAKDRAQRLAHDAASEGQRLATMAEQGFRDHPLAVGAALFAVGTAIGASLPSTVREARWLGERRDELVDRAREAARGAVKKVGALASASAPAE